MNGVVYAVATSTLEQERNVRSPKRNNSGNPQLDDIILPSPANKSKNEGETVKLAACKADCYVYDDDFTAVSLPVNCIDVIEKIGSGSFACVYRAMTKTKLPTEVAVKAGKTKDECSKITSELHILKHLNNRFIVKARFGFCSYGRTSFGMQCMVCDLFSLMSTTELTIPEATFYICEILLGLEYLRDQDVVHGDIKPENIGITNEGHVKVMDFGEAVKLTGKHLNPLTGIRERVSHSGTVPYCSPEKLLREPHGTEVDLWSLGVLAHELYFGYWPFGLDDCGDDKQESICRIVNCHVLEPHHEEMEKPFAPSAFLLVKGMLARNRKRRLCAPEIIKRQRIFTDLKIDWRRARFTPPFVLSDESEQTEDTVES